jgi:hypothetical protein
MFVEVAAGQPDHTAGAGRDRAVERRLDVRRVVAAAGVDDERLPTGQRRRRACENQQQRTHQQDQ